MPSQSFRTLVRSVLAVLFISLSSFASAALPKVLIVGADSDAGLADVKAKLAGTNRFAQIDTFHADTGTPTAQDLQPYDAVLLYSGDFYVGETVKMGDVLADYVDHGGGLVVAGFITGNAAIGGRLVKDSYLAVKSRISASVEDCNLVPVLASNPILDGATAFPGGAVSRALRDVTTLEKGATLVAKWSDGPPLAAYRQFGTHRVVDLTFNPVSAAVRAESWDPAGQGARLMANALVYSIGQELRPDLAVITDTPAAGADIAAKLKATKAFGLVDVIDASTSTPDQTQVGKYTCVLLHSQTSFADPNALGDVLADFVEAGGGLVLTAPRTANSPHPGGRLEAAGYLSFPPPLQVLGNGETLALDVAGDPLFTGVTKAAFGTSSIYAQPLLPGAVQVAHFKAAGNAAAAYQTINGWTVTTLNFEPTSTDYDPHGWQANTDVGQLIANALTQGAAAPALPDVTALEPTDVNIADAVLHASVNAHGQATTVYFYLNGQFVGSVAVSAGVGLQQVDLLVQNLAGNRQYVVTAYAENSVGGTLGTENGSVSVKTGNNPPNALDVQGFYTGTPVVVDLLQISFDFDGDKLTTTMGSIPYGQTTKNGSVVVYTPGDTFPGIVSVPFQISDGHDTITQTLTIRSLIPVANVIATAGPGASGGTVQGRSGGRFTSFGAPSVYAGGRVGSLASYVPTGSTKPVSAILGGDTFTILRQTGDAAGGVPNAVYSKFGQPVFSANAYAFSATLAPAPGKTLPPGQNQGLFLGDGVQTQCVALSGSPTILPVGAGEQYVSILGYSMATDLGKLFYLAKVRGPGITPGKNDIVLERAYFDGGILMKDRKAPPERYKNVQLFTPAPGLPSQPRGITSFGQAVTLSTSPTGQRSFDVYGDYTDPLVIGSFAIDAGADTGIPNSAFATVTAPCMAGNGAAYFLATLKNTGTSKAVNAKNNAGIFRVNSPYNVVVRSGTAGPIAGSTYTVFSQPAASHNSNNARMAFTATLAGTPAAEKTVLMWNYGVGLIVAAQTGKPAAGLDGLTYAHFDSFALPPSAQGPVFLAKLAGKGVNATNNTALFARRLGSVQLLARTGTLFKVGQQQKTISLISTLGATTDSPTQGRFVNGEGNLVTLLTFTDHTTALVRWYIP